MRRQPHRLAPLLGVHAGADEGDVCLLRGAGEPGLHLGAEELPVALQPVRHGPQVEQHQRHPAGLGNGLGGTYGISGNEWIHISGTGLVCLL